MSKIKILDNKLINKIAAGEVIENPSSVIKELVENSIDAQASNIKIEIKGSGLQLIKVEDDGVGMSKEDAILCFKRHATSKIKSFEDLINIHSMGFRGEALASIAAISQIDLKTSQDTIATYIKVDASKVIQMDEIARTKGITIEVKSLFYNVPVRKYFQKTTSHINSEIIKTVNMLALANPKIGFTLLLNEKLILSAQKSNSDIKTAFKQRIKDLLSKNFLKNCFEIDFEKNNTKIYGFIGQPNASKKTRSSQYLIVNGRVIKSNLISKNIKDGYFTRISEEDFPIFVLKIDISPDLIDVNVHPQKKEIRVSKKALLEETLKKAIDKAFERQLQKSNVVKPSVKSNASFDDQKLPDTDYAKENIFEKFQKQLLFEKFYNVQNEITDFLQLDSYLFIDSSYFYNNFDIESDEKLLVIDLAAIFAYMLFEKMNQKNKFLKMQNLVSPITIDLGLEDTVFVEENYNSFFELGFDLRRVSQTCISIDALDEIIKLDFARELLLLILQDLKEKNKTTRIDELYEKRLAKSLLKLAKTKKYDKKEAQKILSIFLKYKNLKFDKLGNPIFVKLNKIKVDKLFS